MSKTIYFNGRILTMDPKHPHAEAVLTENGRILAVGAYDDLKNENIAPFDLQGATLMPAFVDGHSHILGLGLEMLRSCDLLGCESFDELLSRIRKFRHERGLTHGEPILCNGYDPALMKEGRHPSAALLDSLGFDNPISCVHQSGHIAVYNTVAMRQAGVLEEGFQFPAGGVAARDEKGHLTGYFEETARHPFKPLFAVSESVQDMEKAILLAQKEYIKHGFATVQEGSGGNAAQLAAFRNLADRGELQVDTVWYLSANTQDAEMRREALATHGKGYRNHLKLGGVKMFLDGSPQARTAWLSRPYEGESSYCGYPRFSDDEVEARMSLALDEGWQVMAHCNGDAAAEQFLSVFERLQAQKELAGKDLRPVMIHAQTVRYDQLWRMARARMMASFFVDHCYFWGDVHLQNLGERAMRISPTKRALELGIPFSLHQDCPVTRPDMLRSVKNAVNRTTRSGVVLGQELCLDPYEALIAATRGGAYTYFEENLKGILQAGAFADLVILDRDPTAVLPTEIGDIKVLCTIKQDRVLYRA